MSVSSYLSSYSRLSKGDALIAMTLSELRHVSSVVSDFHDQFAVFKRFNGVHVFVVPRGGKLFDEYSANRDFFIYNVNL